jgi:cytidylate kinase
MNKKLGIVIGLSALVLITLVVGAVASAKEPVAEKTEGDLSSGAKSEQLVTHHYANDAAFLAANPEIRIVRRYAAERTKMDDAAFLAANPEIRIVRRYAAQVTQVDDAAFLAANPEIRVHRRYVAERAGQ